MGFCSIAKFEFGNFVHKLKHFFGMNLFFSEWFVTQNNVLNWPCETYQNCQSLWKLQMFNSKNAVSCKLHHQKLFFQQWVLKWFLFVCINKASLSVWFFCFLWTWCAFHWHFWLLQYFATWMAFAQIWFCNVDGNFTLHDSFFNSSFLEGKIFLWERNYFGIQKFCLTTFKILWKMKRLLLISKFFKCFNMISVSFWNFSVFHSFQDFCGCLYFFICKILACKIFLQMLLGIFQ